MRTGIRFLDHMLELFARHGAFDLTVDAKATSTSTSTTRSRISASRSGGCLFCARRAARHQPRRLFRDADGRNAGRRGHRSERAATAVVDLKVKVVRVGDLQTELVHDFFEGFAIGARATLHVKVLYGRSSHHHIEAVFKAFARALRFACSKDKRLARVLPSTKGCCDRPRRLPRGNLTSVRKAFGALGAELFTPRVPPTWPRRRRLSCPVSDISARPALLGLSGWKRSSSASARAGRCSASASGCNGCSKAARKRQSFPAWAFLAGSAIACARKTSRSHVGWNALDLKSDASIVDAIDNGSQVYFTHSFVAPVTGDTVAVTEHGEPFAAVVQRGHVAGVQFHPEKSGDVGLRILRNFLSLVG